MRYPQLLVYETDGRLAQRFKDLADERQWDKHARLRLWSLHEVRNFETCAHLLRRGGPSVLVLKLGRDLGRELTLLDRISWLFPEAATIVVGDTDNAVLAGLAWDLGARYVHFPPQARERLLELVAGLLEVNFEQPEVESQ